LSLRVALLVRRRDRSWWSSPDGRQAEVTLLRTIVVERGRRKMNGRKKGGMAMRREMHNGKMRGPGTRRSSFNGRIGDGMVGLRIVGRFSHSAIQPFGASPGVQAGVEPVHRR
jgi:hypothetical protein